MSEQTIHIYEDGLLIGVKKRVNSVKEPPINKALKLINATKALNKEYIWQFDVLAQEIYSLRKNLIKLAKLLEIRTNERNSVRDAHRARLEQLRSLEEAYSELLEQMEDDEDETISLKDIQIDRPRAVAARAIKK